ncbi:uncharacterized protein BDR25DRAFT_33219 [Lindgomyces ingoldianus]|uniref:Uncharacterized protein n=1 Tax=Lindgomyces ingoldianus TaxID=673940 RepID=A0ACB6QVH0_9PLEO|nr:uncharacterized protein BDR25DRAFT_33219 [Lindgomyces ingoldianus]KAF2470277.1 hypothetical protein BDR25DRAFT_33219 [Lindgomyces ingoldianus]
MNSSFPVLQGQPPSVMSRPPIYHLPPPDEPPPSYDDATHSSSSPLLVGPPPNYGTYQAYPEPDASSSASSDIEETTRALPEWVGQALVVLVFLGILYGFWRLVNDPMA